MFYDAGGPGEQGWGLLCLVDVAFDIRVYIFNEMPGHQPKNTLARKNCDGHLIVMCFNTYLDFWGGNLHGNTGLVLHFKSKSYVFVILKKSVLLFIFLLNWSVWVYPHVNTSQLNIYTCGKFHLYREKKSQSQLSWYCFRAMGIAVIKAYDWLLRVVGSNFRGLHHPLTCNICYTSS